MFTHFFQCFWKVLQNILFVIQDACVKFLKNTTKYVLVGMLIMSIGMMGLLSNFPHKIHSAHAFFGDFSIKDEVELGKKFDILVRSRLPLIEDPEVKIYVQDLVKKLINQAPAQPFNFTTSVLLHNSLNAFASPGGYLFVHTGLIMQLEHESELAGVLAHELAHATQRHIASRIEKAQTMSIVSMLGALAGALLGGGGDATGAIMAGSLAANQTMMLNYSRIDETEADEIGLQYLIKAGFKPQGMVGAFEKIRDKQWSSGSNIPTYLSTHPAVDDRITGLTARIQSLPQSVQNRPESDEQFLRVRALCRARYGDVHLAKQLFLAEDENNAMTHLGRAILNARINDVQQATKDFDKALELAPNDELIWREAGRFHYLKGDKHRAAVMLQRATIMDPKDYMALFFYARLLSDTVSPTTAYPYFKDILRYVPEDSEVHYYYARALAAGGDLFGANLHTAYSALYENNKGKMKQFLQRAKSKASTPEHEEALKMFELKLQHRQEFWK